MDFSGLDDEQLIELLNLAMAEAIRRGGAVRAAAQSEVLSAQEKSQIEARVAAKYALKKETEERERIAREAETRLREAELEKQVQATESTWSHKAAIAAAIKVWGYEDDFELNIWSRGADRRVYFQGTNERNKTWKYCLYLTGNDCHAPGHFTREGVDSFFLDKGKLLKLFLIKVAEGWRGDLKTTHEVGGTTPSARLAQYLKVLGLEVPAHV